MTALSAGAPPASFAPLPVEVRDVHLSDPLVEPLLAGLSAEYRARYHDLLTEEQHRAEMAHYAAEEFAPPVGALVLLLVDGEPVAGGALRRRLEPELGEAARLARPDARDADGVPAVPTAELKRIWTHDAHRRQGLARRVLAELEARARDLGYPRLYLTTGPRQPEAAGLYRSTGYTPLTAAAAGEPADLAEEQPFGPLPFEKWLTT
ncbi:GNAT family N-acetyltransferase [Promicromonospora sukumoe]